MPKGRKKTSQTKIDNQSNLQVTFSKRRMGLFKKANELAIICGAEATFIVFSPAGNVYSFSHPSIDVVVNKYLDHDGDSNITNILPNPSNSSDLLEITKEIAKTKNLWDESNKKGKQFDNRDSKNPIPWDVTKTDGLSLEHVEKLAEKMEKFCHDMMVVKAKQISLATLKDNEGTTTNPTSYAFDY
ncbi:hypothetical protein Leryth_020995 [Lithospermum erythrorhizon]|nr:hypothetical protein Leryth_020995 [Lithospermum erythrorhizon]